MSIFQISVLLVSIASAAFVISAIAIYSGWITIANDDSEYKHEPVPAKTADVNPLNEV